MRETFNKLTLFSVVRYLAQIQEVRANDGVSHRVALPQLYLNPLAERREHLGEHDLLVPNGAVRVLLHARAALEKKTKKWNK